MVGLKVAQLDIDIVGVFDETRSAKSFDVAVSLGDLRILCYALSGRLCDATGKIGHGC